MAAERGGGKQVARREKESGGEHGELVIDGVKPRRVCARRIRMWGQAPTLEEEWPRGTAHCFVEYLQKLMSRLGQTTLA